MGRPVNPNPRTSITLRLDQDLKERLLAAMFHDAAQASPQKDLAPSDLNISEQIRELLEDYVQMTEEMNGGRETLAYRKAEADRRRLVRELKQADEVMAVAGRQGAPTSASGQPQGLSDSKLGAARGRRRGQSKVTANASS